MISITEFTRFDSFINMIAYTCNIYNVSMVLLSQIGSHTRNDNKLCHSYWLRKRRKNL